MLHVSPLPAHSASSGERCMMLLDGDAAAFDVHILSATTVSLSSLHEPTQTSQALACKQVILVASVCNVQLS